MGCFSRLRTASVLGLALYLAPVYAQAETLANLFAGSSIAVGNLNFSNFQLTLLEKTNGGTADFGRIDITPLVDDPRNLGIGVFPQGDALSTPRVHDGLSSVLLKFSYDVTTINGLPMLEGQTLKLTGWDFQTRPDSLIRIIEDSGSPFSLMGVIVFRDDPPDSPLLMASVTFFGSSSLHVQTQIDIYSPQSNDAVKLWSYENRFFQNVPEPSTLASAGALLLGAIGRRIRRRT